MYHIFYNLVKHNSCVSSYVQFTVGSDELVVLVEAPLDAAQLGHHPVEEEQVVGTDPDARAAQVEALEPVKHVHIVLEVHLADKAAEDNEDGGLGGPEAVNDHGGLVCVRQSGEAIHQVDTVGDRHTEVGPVGTEDQLDGEARLVVHLEAEGDSLVSRHRGLGK